MLTVWLKNPALRSLALLKCGLLVLMIMIAMASQTAVAQETSTILGTVKDASGAVLPGVALTVRHSSTGLERHLLTDSRGDYEALSLPLGEYDITAALPNFQSQTRSGIQLQVRQPTRVDLTLRVGQVAQQVTVSEATPLLRTTNAEVSETITNQRIVGLPLNGRQFIQLSLLSDNVFLSPEGSRGAALAQTGPQVAIAGQRAGHNMYFLDGVSITDQYFNNLVLSPSIDAIQEFKIQKSIYSAEYGGKASANISLATKSGSNQMHGSLYEFVRNNLFDARNYFDPANSIPAFRQNQFGGTLGGPIRKNKTFFFGSYEGFRERKGQTQTFSLPSAQVRAGDFSNLPTIYDPLTVDPVTGKRQAFAGNKIPLNRLDPVAIAFLAKLPLPNLAGEVQNLITSPSEKNNQDQFTVRGDHYISSKDSVFARFTFANITDFQPYGNANLNETLVPGFGYQITTFTRNVALNETHVFNSHLLNDLRVGYLRVTGGQQSQNQGINFAAQAGLLGVTTDPKNIGYPAISFAGLYSSAGDPGTLVSRRDNSFDFVDNLSWIRGAHTMKFGTYIFRLRFNPLTTPNARGSFAFTPRFSSSTSGAADGNAFADFLLGYPTSAQSGLGQGEEDGRTLWTHFYAQDDWRVRPDLTFSIGVRYEINSQITDVGNRLSNIELNRFVIASNDQGQISPLANPLLSSIPVPWVTSKQAGYGPALIRPSYSRIVPRVGLAWSPFGSKKTAIRAGFGMFENQAAYSVQTNLALNLPFYFNKSVNTSVNNQIPTNSTENILLSPNSGSIGGNGVNYNYSPEYAESWNLSVQQTVFSDWAVQASYFGSKVIHADSSTFVNVPVPGPGAIGPRRPDPSLSSFRTIRWDGYSNFNSLNLKVEKRYSRGLTLDANYTFSKAIDDASDPGATFPEYNVPQDVRNLAAEKALSSFDHRHRAVMTWLYEVPLGSGHTLNPSGWMGSLVKGWSVTGIAAVQSGAPFTVNLPTDNANIGSGPAQRPNLTGNPNLGAGRSALQWFNTAAFQLPAAYTFGNAGRNIVIGPGSANLDASLLKSTALRESSHVEFRADIFNLLNHTNFAGTPGRIAFTPSFGRIFSAGSSREIQLALKYVF